MRGRRAAEAKRDSGGGRSSAVSALPGSTLPMLVDRTKEPSSSVVPIDLDRVLRGRRFTSRDGLHELVVLGNRVRKSRDERSEIGARIALDLKLHRAVHADESGAGSLFDDQPMELEIVARSLVRDSIWARPVLLLPPQSTISGRSCWRRPSGPGRAAT